MGNAIHVESSPFGYAGFHLVLWMGFYGNEQGMPLRSSLREAYKLTDLLTDLLTD